MEWGDQPHRVQGLAARFEAGAGLGGGIDSLGTGGVEGRGQHAEVSLGQADGQHRAETDVVGLGREVS